MNKRWATQFLEKYTSHFIVKVWVWEGVGDRTELQYIDPHSSGHQSCVFLVLQGCSTGSPEAHSAGCWLSLPHLVTNSSDLQLNRGSKRPLLPDGGFPYHIFLQLVWSPTHWLPVFTELYNSSIAHSISILMASQAGICYFRRLWTGMFDHHHQAEITVMQFRDHSLPVHQSECTMGFYIVPFCQPSPPTRFLLITAIGMCHFLPVHHFGMACLVGSKVNIQQKF